MGGGEGGGRRGALLGVKTTSARLASLSVSLPLPQTQCLPASVCPIFCLFEYLCLSVRQS